MLKNALNSTMTKQNIHITYKGFFCIGLGNGESQGDSLQVRSIQHDSTSILGWKQITFDDRTWDYWGELDQDGKACGDGQAITFD